uniref:Uncharacterized protein n=1 Tax=Panagrellus redivivus TaxID=6233 RepID=A0A7E4UMU3_PANRE
MSADAWAPLHGTVSVVLSIRVQPAGSRERKSSSVPELAAAGVDARGTPPKCFVVAVDVDVPPDSHFPLFESREEGTPHVGRVVVVVVFTSMQGDRREKRRQTT